MAKINVLKPFVFTPTPSPGRRGQPHEIQYGVGEHEVPDYVADHPWIAKDFADGKIETPAQAAARAQEAAERAQTTAAEAEAARLRSEAAMERAAAAHGRSQVVSDADAAMAGTPVSQLPRGGTSVGPGTVAGGADLEVPVDELKKRQSAGRAAN